MSSMCPVCRSVPCLSTCTLQKMSKIGTSDRYERFIIRQTKDVGTLVWEVFDINVHKVYGYYTSYGEAEEKRDLLVRDRLYNVEIPPSPKFSLPPETVKACEDWKAEQMSKIDASEFDPVAFNPDSGNYSLWYNNKEYSYFTSEAGARAYLEVLRNGKDTIIPRGIEEEEIRAVPKVHGVLQGTGSAGSYQSRKRTYPELL